MLVFCNCSHIHGAENVVSPEAEESTSGLPTAPRRSDVWIAGTWTDAAMTRMAEKLQPTGMTGFTGRAQPDQTAADEQEKKQAYGEHRKALAEKLGIHKLHFAVHTYHHQLTITAVGWGISTSSVTRASRFRTTTISSSFADTPEQNALRAGLVERAE